MFTASAAPAGVFKTKVLVALGTPTKLQSAPRKSLLTFKVLRIFTHFSQMMLSGSRCGIGIPVVFVPGTLFQCRASAVPTAVDRIPAPQLTRFDFGAGEMRNKSTDVVVADKCDVFCPASPVDENLRGRNVSVACLDPGKKFVGRYTSISSTMMG